MSREPDGGDPRASPRDIEAARLRARMREAVFKRPAEKVRIDRFEIVRRLGAGAMGLVYEVTDPRTGGHLALKTVRTHNPRALALFKREFRSLTRVTHPNLVSLYELGRDDNTFFFTMELIRGVTLLRYLWGSDEPPPGRDQLPASPVLDFDRLRGVLSQLAAGVAALHDAGKLHRDIKPTNVMVTADGRVVLMDFGFVTDQLGSMLESTQGSLVVGTPAFMPPEQSRAERLGAAADWYSVGATLYLALTGQPPYSGLSAAEILLSKETEPPAHPRLLARGIPADLGDLCVDLLQPDPKARPSEADILARTRAAAWGRRGARSPTRPPADARRRSSLIGLSEPLTRLSALYAEGPTSLRIARVVGAAGQGKSRLIAHFLETLKGAAEPKPLLLRTRCNPGDAVPAQALDGLVDGLARHLRLLDRGELEAILPATAPALVTLFPVLSQVPALAALRDPAPTRAAGFAALRELLAGLARLRPLVLWIDDLQWSDPEGCHRLRELLAAPSPPPLLMIVSYRPEDADASPELGELLAALGGDAIELKPLAADEAVNLAATLLGDHAGADEAARIAAEAERSPLWIHELTRLAEHVPEPTLAELVGHRLRELPKTTVDLVSLAALALRPLPLDLAAAAGIREQALHSGLRRATAAHLLRLSITPRGDRLAPFDDRVRTAILSHLSGPKLRELHRRLAVAIEQRRTTEPELLIHHLRGAGELEQAQRYALLHAEQREVRGDLLGAANLLRLAHELGVEDARGAALLRRLGRTLAAAGHELEAGEVLLRALPEIDDPDEALELWLLAARLLLTSGEEQAGCEALAEALNRLGLPAIDAPTGTFGALLRAGQLRLRGLRFRERDSASVARRELLQVDASFTASVGLAGARPALAAEAQARHLSLALRIGEPCRIARALALEALRLADAGEVGRTGELLSVAADLAERGDAEHLRALVTIARAAVELQAGHPADAMALVDAVADRPRAPVWERVEARRLWLDAALLRGELDAARRRAETWIAAAEAARALRERDALIARRLRLDLAAGLEVGELPAATARSVDLRSWPIVAMAAEADLARGAGDEAQATIDAWLGNERPAALVGALALDLRARASLTCGDVDEAERDSHHLRRRAGPIAEALHLALEAAVAARRGASEATEDDLDAAAARFEAVGLPLRAAACRWRRFADEPVAREALAVALRRRGVADPARMAALLLPWP